MSDHASKTGDRAEHRAADRRRAAKLRQRREQAGQVRIQAWVPRERATYARQVLHAAAAGANALPPDPGYQAELDTTRADAAAMRAKLEEVRAASDHRAEAAERGREEVARELVAVRAEAEAAQSRERAAQEAADALRGELAGIRGQGGWRGVLLRLAGAGRPHGAGGSVG